MDTEYALMLAEDGRILYATGKKDATSGMVLVSNIPDDGRIVDYRYVDGAYVYDPLPAMPESTEPDVWDEMAAAIREGVDSLA